MQHMANLPSSHSGGVGFSTRSCGSYRGCSTAPGSTGFGSVGFSSLEPSPELGILVLLGMPWSRSSKGKEGVSPSKRAWLNSEVPCFASNGIWGKGDSGELIPGGMSLWVCWLVVPGRSPRLFKVSSSGVDEKASLFASLSGVIGMDEGSTIISEEVEGLDIEIVFSPS